MLEKEKKALVAIVDLQEAFFAIIPLPGICFGSVRALRTTELTSVFKDRREHN